MKSSKHFVLRLVALSILLFVGMNVPFLIGRIPESKNGPPCLVGIMSWLWVGQGQHGPYIQHVWPLRMIAEFLIAGGAAWGLVALVSRIRTRKAVGQ
jgi:hypothetical protein